MFWLLRNCFKSSFQRSPCTQFVLSMFVVECVWLCVGRSMLLSVLHAVWSVLALLHLLCCPSTLFFSLHQTSPHALCSLDVCAPWMSTPAPPFYSHGASFALLPIVLPSHVPASYLLLMLFYLHLVSKPPSFFFISVSVFSKCPIIHGTSGSFNPLSHFLYLFGIHNLELDAWGAECVQGWRSVLRWIVKHTYTTCISWGKETAILWCEDRWLPLLIIFSITWPHIWPAGSCMYVHVCVWVKCAN